MWTEKQRRGWDAIDDAAQRAGGYLATPKRPLVVDYDYRAMSNYCAERGITNADLTDDEIKKFEYSKPLIYD